MHKIYEKRKDMAMFDPSWFATEALTELDPDLSGHDDARVLAHLHLRQIAREVLRRKFEISCDETEKHDMFPDLQAHYPAARTKGEEPRYIKLEHMAVEDVEFNVHRLRGEAEAKLKHADALEAWWQSRLAAA